MRSPTPTTRLQAADAGTIDLTGTVVAATLEFRTSYWNTEDGWDYVFVEVHTVGQRQLDDAAGPQRPHVTRTRARAARRLPTRTAEPAPVHRPLHHEHGHRLGGGPVRLHAGRHERHVVRVERGNSDGCAAVEGRPDAVRRHSRSRSRSRSISDSVARRDPGHPGSTTSRSPPTAPTVDRDLVRDRTMGGWTVARRPRRHRQPANDWVRTTERFRGGCRGRRHRRHRSTSASASRASTRRGPARGADGQVLMQFGLRY